jgi:protein-tyrosine phosphatase
VLPDNKMPNDEAVVNNERWIARRYGSRRSFVRTYWHRIRYLLGGYRAYRQIDWSSVERLVFICKGNICRSVYAEAAARSLGIEAISCGLDTIEGAPANKDAILVARQLGFSLEDHRTKPIMYIPLRKTDLLIAMEPWHCEFLKTHLSRPHHCTLLGLWSIPVLPYITDPYGASPEYFEKCFTYIKDSVNEIGKKIEK